VSEPPITTEVGADLYAGIQPLTYADEALGWPLAHYCDALGVILEETAKLVRADGEGNDGWSAFADPKRCPSSYLYTLAQWAGIRYARRMSEADLRPLIGPHAPGLWRGTREALIATIARYQTPGASVYFEERADGDPYKLRIHTYASETLDEAAIQKELLGHVPAGLILDYRIQTGMSYAVLRGMVVSYAEMRSRFATYEAVRTYAPPPP
jgi:hypothetical protein